MDKEVNGPAMIMTHIKVSAFRDVEPDIQFIYELAAITVEYMREEKKSWHEVKDEWREKNPNHSSELG